MPNFLDWCPTFFWVHCINCLKNIEFSNHKKKYIQLKDNSKLNKKWGGYEDTKNNAGVIVNLKGFSINGSILKKCAGLFSKIAFNVNSDDQNEEKKRNKDFYGTLNSHRDFTSLI